MCGFAGIAGARSTTTELSQELIKMGGEIAHRGPDDSDVFIVPDNGLGIIHKRLSILDVTKSGRQPMASRCGRFVVAYNGEIYNFKGLREKLREKGHSFFSNTDTEVLLCAIQEWGLHSALSQCIGMFAFALFDRKEMRLQLVRDRIGEKPLYYGWQNETFLFGSELKALRKNSQWSGMVDDASLAEMLQLSYVPAPKTIYKNVFKVEPGQVVTLELNKPDIRQVNKEQWWSYATCLHESAGEYACLDDEEVLGLWEAEFKDVIQDSSLADVPLGAFLSGGIDSSLVTACLQETISRPVKTFSIGFTEKDYDESQDAREVARYLGTDHSCLLVSDSDVCPILPDLPIIYDEPFADSSQVLVALLARFARQRVTVALSGDGGDEMFGGYNRYRWASTLARLESSMPRMILKGGSMLSILTEGLLRTLHNSPARGILPDELNVAQVSRQLRKLSEVLNVKTLDDRYRILTRESAALGILEATSDPYLEDPAKVNAKSWTNDSSVTEYFNYADITQYLPDDILVKVDRASMACGLEIRAPFLDHRVVKFSAKLSWDQKISRRKTKVILRKSLEKRLPAKLFGRPKKGFALPIERWLRGPLRNWAEDLLSEAALKDAGLAAPVVRKLWEEHHKRRQDHATVLWNVLMYQAWFAKYQG